LGCSGSYFGTFRDVFEDAEDIDRCVFFDFIQAADFEEVVTCLRETNRFIALYQLATHSTKTEQDTNV